MEWQASQLAAALLQQVLQKQPQQEATEARMLRIQTKTQLRRQVTAHLPRGMANKKIKLFRSIMK
jgi:hypothetical protein